MYWFYSYIWRNKPSSEWVYSMAVYKGSFSDMVLSILEQKEERRIIYAREITKEDYDNLKGHIEV